MNSILDDNCLNLRGLSIDEIYIGMKKSMTKTISEHDVYAFAGITGDFNPIHVNEEYAKTTRFGSRIAHGMLFCILCFYCIWNAFTRRRCNLFESIIKIFKTGQVWGHSHSNGRSYQNHTGKEVVLC